MNFLPRILHEGLEPFFVGLLILAALVYLVRRWWLSWRCASTPGCAGCTSKACQSAPTLVDISGVPAAGPGKTANCDADSSQVH